MALIGISSFSALADMRGETLVTPDRPLPVVICGVGYNYSANCERISAFTRATITHYTVPTCVLKENVDWPVHSTPQVPPAPKEGNEPGGKELRPGRVTINIDWRSTGGTPCLLNSDQGAEI